jgi:hypothetical protein
MNQDWPAQRFDVAPELAAFPLLRGCSGILRRLGPGFVLSPGLALCLVFRFGFCLGLGRLEGLDAGAEQLQSFRRWPDTVRRAGYSVARDREVTLGRIDLDLRGVVGDGLVELAAPEHAHAAPGRRNLGVGLGEIDDDLHPIIEPAGDGIADLVEIVAGNRRRRLERGRRRHVRNAASNSRRRHTSLQVHDLLTSAGRLSCGQTGSLVR